MRKLCLVLLASALVLSGCVARTYQLTKDRIDQNLQEGNRGYIMGSHPGTESPRDPDRTVRVFEFELGRPYKAKGVAPKAGPAETLDYAPAPALEEDASYPEPQPESVSYSKYTVQKNDTLQKISQKFYGTTKKWLKIYNANKDTLKTPDKVYPGQELNIPEESIKEEAKPKERSKNKVK